MREQVIDLWEAHKSPLAAAGIPTNGIVTSSGRLVRGAGVALQAKHRFPDLDYVLGDLIFQAKTNRVFYCQSSKLFTFPTKLSWNQNAVPAIIERSSRELSILARNHSDRTFYLPRPGCGLGRLNYRDVRPLLLRLPDNVIVITNKKDA